MEGYKSRIGKDQMRQYMGGLYENSMVIYREYLQNACDAVEQALQEGLIPNRQQANIGVRLDTFNKCITIEDVGIGIARENIGPYLVDVASSQKFCKELVGRHGIGRLNGANYCDRIIYETSFSGEPIKSILIWDVKKARELCAPNADDIDTPAIIDMVTELLPEEPEEIGKHYCKVTLENVNDPQLLDEKAVKDYISEIVSVDYSLEFREVVMDEAMELPMNLGYKERFENLWTYQVTVNSNPVEKTYRSEYEGKYLGTMQCFTLTDEKTGEELAWGWYCLNRTAEQLNDLPFSFIRVRHHNFQIGASELLNGYYKSTTAPAYSVGEVHITHPKIHPTATRDGIEGGPERRKLEGALKKFFTKIYDQYNKASKFRSEVVDKIAAADVEIARLKRTLKEDPDSEEKKKIRETIKKKQQDRTTALENVGKYQQFFSETGRWIVASDIVDAVNSKLIEPYNKRSAVELADAQIPELNLTQFQPTKSDIPPHENTDANNISSTSVPQESNPGKEVSSAASTDIPDTPKVPNEMDDYKNLSTVERGMVRKFLSVINSMNDVPDKQKKKIKDKLKKKLIK